MLDITHTSEIVTDENTAFVERWREKLKFLAREILPSVTSSITLLT
jgi:hypothetical protein